MPSSITHESEWVYSTSLTRKLKLTELNDAIHSIPSVYHPVELFIFACGYAFNPVMFPIWLGLIHFWTQQSLQHGILTDKPSDAFAGKWRRFLQTKSIRNASMTNTALYFASVLVTLAFTELGKASFATTRPTINNHAGTSSEESKWIRRYGTLVSSLKSKHSFPSGDCAQAMNLCMFLYKYIPVESSLRDTILFGLFLPGVAFARVFYRCHWIEDTMGGAVLAALLHWLIVPIIGEKITNIQYEFIS
jgi:membrane-associated phospholipid phosphatase